MTEEEKAKRYDEAIERAKGVIEQNPLMEYLKKGIEYILPELKESEDERIRKGIIRNLEYLADRAEGFVKDELKERIAWLEKPVKCKMDSPQNHQDSGRPNGGIVFEDFNGGEGFYKLHLDYLNKKQVEEVEEMIRTWNKESKASNENIKNCIGMCLTDAAEQRFKDYNTNLKECLAWLEKQGTPAKLIEEEQNRFAKGVLTSCALSFIDYLDAHKYESKMCVSNGECEDIENAFHNAMWDRLHRYYCKYIEKQGEQKSVVIIPKFRIGDEIKTSNEESLTITKIDEKGYWSEDLFICGFDEECIWDLVEPKFHEGDWVVLSTSDGEKVVQIDSIEYFKSGEPRYITSEGRWFGNGTKAHLWTIKDAKPGDVIYLPNGNNEYYFFIFKGIENAAVMSFAHFYQYNDGTSGVEGTIDKFLSVNDVFQPATKEQRDKLEKAMADAGYTFDFKKKELNKIELRSYQWNISDFRTWQYIVSDVLTKHDGIGQYLDNGLCKKIAQDMQEEWSKKLCSVQHHAWSEEDERMYRGLHNLIYSTPYCDSRKELSDWIESIKDKYTWKPSDEQIDNK